MIYFSNCS